MSRPVVSTSAPAKVILFGEHSVVYGHPAIAAAISGRTYVQITPVTKPGVAFNFSLIPHEIVFSYPFDDTSLTNSKHEVHKKSVECALLVCKHFQESLESTNSEGIAVKVSTDLPIGAGLGSSASFSVALSAAFHTYELVQSGSVERSPDGTILVSDNLLTKIENLSFECEKVFHGNPSGIDTSVCTHGGIVKFQRSNSNVSFKKIAESLPVKIAVVDSQVPRQTSVLVQSVKDLKMRHPAVVDAVLDAMGQVAEAATSETTCERLIELARVNQGLLYALGVSHPVLEEINAAVAGTGVGFKLTGAGGGGNAILFIPPNVHEDEIIAKLKDHGFEKVLVVSVGGPGLQITVEESGIR